MELYKHNQKAYESMQEKFKTSNKTAIIHPTGTGKMVIFLKWLIDNPNQSFLFLAPNSAIMYQLQYTIEENGFKISDFPNLKCALYCQLLNWNTEDFKVEYDNIVLDEFHRAGAPKWGQAVNFLLENHPNSKVLGLSATPTRYVDHKNMADVLFEGNIASEITLAEAMAKGILPLPTYINTVYSLNEQIKELEEKIKRVKESSKKLKLEELLEKAKSNLLQVEGFEEIFQKHISKKDGKYLIFCKDINHLEEVKEKVKEWFNKVNSEIEIYDIHSKHEDIENERTLRKYRKDKSSKLKLLLSVEMLNEGLHVEDIDGVIMLRPTESHIIYLQQLGRGLSINSNSPLIIDIVNNIGAYQNIYDIREEIEEIIERNPSECISEEELDIKFKIIDYVQNVMEALQEIDIRFQLSNSEKISIIQAYLQEGHLYKEITISTQDKDGHKIGQWISCWRYGLVQLTKEERKTLISMGETFEKKNLPKLNNQKKLSIIQEYLDKGYHYQDIKRESKDENGYPMGKWIDNWRQGAVQLTEEERKILVSMGETFEKKRQKSSPITNQKKLSIIRKYLNEEHQYKGITISTIDKEGHKIGQWINQWRNGMIALTEEERKILTSMGETFERKYLPRLSNREKLAIIRQYLNNGYKYENIMKNTKDNNEYPIGMWINDWRRGAIPLTEDERQTLILMGETFHPKRKLNVYSLPKNVVLQKNEITVSKKR